MAKVSSTSEELRNESYKVIIDSSRNLDDHRTSFDEECRKIQYGDSGRSLSDLIRQDTFIRKQKARRAYDSCLCKFNDATSSIQKRAPTPPQSAQTHSHEANVCEESWPLRSTLIEKHDVVDLNMQQQMNAEDFVARKLVISNKGARVETKPFSNALEVLSSDKDLFIMELLSESPYCLPHRSITVEKPVNGAVSASFSMREMKRKLKHRFGSRWKHSDKLPKFGTASTRLFGHDCIYSAVETSIPLSSSNTNAQSKENAGKKQGLKVEKEPPFVYETESVRKKIDFSSERLCAKHEADVSWEARIKDLNAIYSLEIEPCLSPRRESRCVCGYARKSLSTSRTSKGVDGTAVVTLRSEMSTDEDEAREEMLPPTPNMKFNEFPNFVESNNISAEKRNCVMDSISDTFEDRVDDFPSSPKLETRDDAKNREEYRSPVSVLDQFFEEDSSSPSNTVFQSARGPLKPRSLCFKEHDPASSPTGADPCTQELDYTISNYVRMIFEASSLNWDQLSAVKSMPEEHMLHPSLSDQARFLMFDSHFDTRLLFDHINEVLLEMQRSHVMSPYWPAFAKPRICCLPLEQVVVDEIMRKAHFYMLPCTERRTLDQLVAKDFSGPQLRPDLRPEAEQIIVLISEGILEESVLDVILQLHS